MSDPNDDPGTPPDVTHTLDLGEGGTAPHGPQVIEVPMPGGAFTPLFGAQEAADEPRPATPKVQWADVVDESAVLCFDCVHGWIMWKHAPTRNLKPDGSPFRQREAYCLFPAQNPGGAPLPLDSRFVLTCNVYKPRDDAAEARRVAQQPHESGADITEPEWAGKPVPADEEST